MEAPSATRRLADTLIEGGLDDFVRTRRDQGKSWRLVARDLFDQTDGAVDITDQTLRSWYPDMPARAS